MTALLCLVQFNAQIIFFCNIRKIKLSSSTDIKAWRVNTDVFNCL